MTREEKKKSSPQLWDHLQRLVQQNISQQQERHRSRMEYLAEVLCKQLQKATDTGNPAWEKIKEDEGSGSESEDEEERHRPIWTVRLLAGFHYFPEWPLVVQFQNDIHQLLTETAFSLEKANPQEIMVTYFPSS